MNVRQKYRSVIEFFHVETIEPINIHRCLLHIYQANAIDASAVKRFVGRFQNGNKDVSDKAHSKFLQPIVHHKQKCIHFNGITPIFVALQCFSFWVNKIGGFILE